MNFMNNSANIKQFQLIRYINENCSDDHVISKISIVLRTKIKMSSCIDRQDNGLIHAMDMLSHHRRHNLTEDKYNEIKSLIVDASDDDNQVKVIEKENQIKVILMSKDDDEFRNLFESYSELFEKIDNLVD